ncbi:hypothetical protein M406DRAFT_75537 [Cryphonectria parasitica EP155]|uniref:Uncharacterized protein n=1 Tax=Cryphonectria parasitica (strain ATCC 38755 / EP155) TaxID=660469 RepID=A0A9P4Y8V7_CRYP1|nr:uncharacterized protein M406DRAFT_75537 [Cryphonectria parasitica EP155]KAF3768195.1 hypothetical protein M406DRAFT_75537 [Cryphonectria parasitica EP155]
MSSRTPSPSDMDIGSPLPLLAHTPTLPPSTTMTEMRTMSFHEEGSLDENLLAALPSPASDLRATPPLAAYPTHPTPDTVEADMSSLGRNPQWPIYPCEHAKWVVHNQFQGERSTTLFDVELGPVACNSTTLVNKDYHGLMSFFVNSPVTP